MTYEVTKKVNGIIEEALSIADFPCYEWENEHERTVFEAIIIPQLKAMKETLNLIIVQKKEAAK